METTPTEIITQERVRDGRGHHLYSTGRRDEIIAAYQASGLTQVAFARREGIKYSTFTAWLAGPSAGGARHVCSARGAAALRRSERAR